MTECKTQNFNSRNIWWVTEEAKQLYSPTILQFQLYTEITKGAGRSAGRKKEANPFGTIFEFKNKKILKTTATKT